MSSLLKVLGTVTSSLKITPMASLICINRHYPRLAALALKQKQLQVDM